MALSDFPLPPDLAVDEPPLTDDDLAAYFGVVDQQARDGGSPLVGHLVADPDETSAGRWRIEADDQAEWALRRLALAHAEQSRLREQADEWAARIQHWFDQASRSHQCTAAFMTERLEDYALRLREAGGPATLTLPSGVIKTTERKPAVEVEDEETLTAYLRVQLEAEPVWTEAYANLPKTDECVLPELIRLTPKVYVGPLRKLVRVGEVDDGWNVRVLSACGHFREFVVSSEDDLSIPDRGEILPCAQCPVDSIDGEARVPVELVTMVLRKRLVPVGPDGELVPGATVNPGGIVPKVEAR